MNKGKGLGLLLASVVLAAAFLHPPGSALALSLPEGTRGLIAIDGSHDGDVMVNFVNIGGTPEFEYGYFLNGGSVFNAVPFFNSANLPGGSVLDFALRNQSTGRRLRGVHPLRSPGHALVSAATRELDGSVLLQRQHELDH
jgi:hypothetical protein